MEAAGTGMPKMNGQNVNVVEASNHIELSVAGTGGGVTGEKGIIFLVILAYAASF
jgi:hypothetical protein